MIKTSPWRCSRGKHKNARTTTPHNHMKSHRNYLILAALLVATTSSYAITTFSTDFDSSEGYVDGPLDYTHQTAAPHFNEAQFAGGFYLPYGSSPNFGTLRRNPTAVGATAYYKIGEGSAFTAGNTWSITLDFTFEGLPDVTPSADAFIASVGFSTSSTSNENSIYAGIKRKVSGSNSANGLYQFFITGGGDAEAIGGVSYTAIGDDPRDDNDLTDNLRIALSLTKSATRGQFDAVAQLINLDTSTTVATITKTLTQSNAYQADLFGYFKSSSEKEDGNFDLFNANAFSYRHQATAP